MNLHSTMYLLNLKWIWETTQRLTFTFHYVSIKSGGQVMSVEHYATDLHSTMYLLNLLTRTQAKTQQPDLHSTMYLLNPQFT